MPSNNLELLRGTLDLLIMRALSVQATHGYGVARWIERATGDALQIEEGSLYPALYRLERRGWIDSEWGFSENNRRARFYRLTRKGKQQLATEGASCFSSLPVSSRAACVRRSRVTSVFALTA